MKRLLSFVTALVLTLCLAAPALASGPAIGTGANVNASAPILTSLTHNCPNTGVMLPKTFNSYTYSYILTVASWVSRVSFTPTAYDPNATIRINGTAIRSGSTSSYFKMTDEPQQVTIEVSNAYGDTNTYTIFLQRRPSERRTRVSAGYINDIYQSSNKWYINADLVTVNYSQGNVSTFTNKTKDQYKHVVTDSCIFYYGTINNPIRAYDIGDFYSNYANYSNRLYRLIYIEDEIVAVMPYAAD